MPLFSILGRLRQATLSNISVFLPTASASIRLLAFGLLFIAFTGHAHAGQVTLAWDANTDPELGGYKLYYGQTSGTYTGNVDAGNQTSYTVTALTAGQTYYFAVTAYDRLRQNESAFSNAVQATIPISTGAPLANFTASPTTGTAALNVAFTDASTGSVTAWNWNFGDGTTGTAKNPSHTYSASGTYSVSLTVTGPGGSNSVSKTNYIAVAAPAPLAAFSAGPTSGTAALNVAFTDASTGSVTAWNWNFGDGTSSTTKNPSHVYSAPGTYSVSLTVTGAGGSKTVTKTNYITVSAPAPVANFNASPTSGTASLNVAFTDTSTGSVSAWNWNFGDGATSTTKNPSHIYSTPGTYSVSLTVTGPGGSKTVTKTNYITVAAPAPVAAFSASLTTGTAALNVAFTDASTGSVSAWNWSFGDGTTGTVKNPSHTYSASGTYSVSLTVTGPGGSNSVTKTNYIAVTPPAPVAGATTTYEDAEDGKIRGWGIFDRSPAGAKITNIFDPDRGNRVIQLTGSGTQNGYQLRKPGGTRWHNRSQFVVQWSMRYSQDFIVYLDVQTNAGHRYLYYTPVNQDGLGSVDVHHGLGTEAMDGQWHTFVRDLQADLAEAQPGVTILEVNGFLIRGSGSVDDIKLDSESVTTYEDAEDGGTSGWGVYADSPAGARITNIFDANRQSRVIQFNGSGINNGYRLGNASDGMLGQWHNSGQFVVQWSMKYAQDFVVYLDVETTAGHRYLYYTPIDQDELGSGDYVHHGLGTAVMDGRWHTFVRDLQVDLTDAQPGVRILEVNGFLIRGSGRVDGIKLR